ncbi:MAG: hypothetical protein M1831_005797 [Alyxoria varia]|nr:MAG: hypothetical protein M1831_005797 [Alyxoria varia]
MGNLCSRSSERKDDNFAGPGRTLGSAPPPPQNRATVPARMGNSQSTSKNHDHGAGRTLGGGGGSSDAQGRAEIDPNMRSAAAEAAQGRANKANQSRGKLGDNLAAQKKQTQNQLLAASSREERGARDADANAESRAYN